MLPLHFFSPKYPDCSSWGNLQLCDKHTPTSADVFGSFLRLFCFFSKKVFAESSAKVKINVLPKGRPARPDGRAETQRNVQARWLLFSLLRSLSFKHQFLRYGSFFVHAGKKIAAQNLTPRGTAESYILHSTFWFGKNKFQKKLLSFPSRRSLLLQLGGSPAVLRRGERGMRPTRTPSRHVASCSSPPSVAHSPQGMQ